MKRIAVTGLSGVIGSVFLREVGAEHELIDLYHTRPVKSKKNVSSHKLNLLNRNEIKNVLSTLYPDVIVHMAAITHIDKCELDRKNGKNGIVWKTNVEATKEIAKFCYKKNIPLIFLSTECVFDGEKKYFSEESKKNPKSWYGISKSEAENYIMSLGGKFAILRSVVAYHVDDNYKTLYGKILKNLKENKEVFGVTDQLFTPTHTLDIANALKKIIDDSLTGIFHVAPEKSMTPYEFARIIAKKNKFPLSLVKRTSLSNLYEKGRGDLRLKHSSLNSKISRKKMKIYAKSPDEII